MPCFINGCFGMDDYEHGICIMTLFNCDKIILDLCGGSGAWSKPYKDAGYNVRVIDFPQDVRLYTIRSEVVYGILAAPPCTHFAGSGARWWKDKGKSAVIEGLSVVDACMRIIMLLNPIFWCLENPVGRLNNYIGKPECYFHPHYYGDPYTKKTALWGRFIFPKRTHYFNKSEIDDRIHKMPPSKDRAKLRSITPAGFAKAFFEANP